jgi:DNA-binding transcriptional regulator/RsmH inhibitor MraZ
MKRKKKYQSFLDVGSAPVVDEKGDVINIAVEPQPTTLAGFIAREEQRERQKQADAARAEHDSRVREYWSQPVTDFTYSVGVRDDIVALQPGQSDADAGQHFLAELTQAGVTLTESGKQRLAAYCQSQWKHLGAAVTVVNLRRAFERLKSLGVFADGEVTESRPAETPVEREPNLGELFARANDSPQADRELRSVIGGMVNAEIREVIEAWQRSVYENYSHKLTETQIREAWRFVQDRNLNPLKPASWDAARRSLVSRSLLSDACLTCREVLERQYREGSINHREFLQRCNTLSIEGVIDKPRQYAAGS